MADAAVREPIKVFLSYRRADTQHVAGRFADKLDDRFAVFMDIDTIPPGVDFTAYVRRAVGHCDVLLAFIGNRWAELTDESGRRRIDDPADWVAEEIRTALDRDVRVIPVLVDGAALPEPASLPNTLRPLMLRQTLPLRHASFSADAARLITAIQMADETGEPYAARWETRPAPPPVQVVLAAPERSHRSRRPWLLAGAALLAAIVIMVGVVVLRPDASPTAASAPDPSSARRTSEPSSSTASSTASPTRPVPGPARTAAQLKTFVPAALAPTCRKINPDAEILRASLQAALQCIPPTGARDPKYLFYFSYADSAAAEQAFRGYYGAATLPAGDCTHTDGELQYDAQGGRPATGTLRCYADADGLGVYAWTNDQLAIVGSTADPNLGFSELKQFWELAGPVAAAR